MAFDGIFLHHLTNELNQSLLGGRVNKIIQISDLELLFQIRSKGQNHQLLVSSSLDSPRIHTTKVHYLPLESQTNLSQLIRKHIEGGYITKIYQHNNDRIITFEFNVSNEIGDIVNRKMIVENMGRNSNIVFTTNDYVIIDSIRRLPPSFEGLRTILPKAIYEYPTANKTINPFLLQTDDADLSNIQGASILFLNEVKDNGSLTSVIHRSVYPNIIKTEQKNYFYCIRLEHIQGNATSFPTLSELLDQVYEVNRSENRLSQQHKNIDRLVSSELQKNQYKLEKLKSELEQAYITLSLQKNGELLAANLYKVKVGDNYVEVEDYYENQHIIKIDLNPNKTPSENLSSIFTKVKKAKNAIIQIEKQIENTIEEIRYLEELLFQISSATSKDIDEIHEELVVNRYVKKGKPIKPKKSIPKFETFIDTYGIAYLVGKNNLQNEYITHKLAAKNNYFFHVKGSPGSHVIARIETQPTESIIRNAANLAALYSPLKQSSSVPVDYTLVKNIKKVSGKKGSFVLLYHQKTIYIDPDISLLQQLTKK
ncbi:MAG TPA: NFACT RNA binding domain-containing protein [Bacilli bacterium]|nr:NFACT RNA binding domain-containing protein [Bacilli bacterium]